MQLPFLMQGGISRKTWRKFRPGRISNYLKPCCFAIVEIRIFSCDRRFLYWFDHCVYSLEAWTNGYWRFETAWGRNLVLYWQLHLSKRNSNEVSRRIFKHRALSLIIKYRTELCLSFVGKKCRFFFVGFGKYFSICSSDVYYTICFNYFKQPNLSRYKAIRSPALPRNPASPRFPDSKIIRHHHRVVWKDTVQNREVSQMK